VRLDRADGAPSLTRDLSNREFTEVAQNDGFPIRLREGGDGLLDEAIALGHEHVGKRLRSSGDREWFARFVLQWEKRPLQLDHSQRAIDRDPEQPTV
jgi:hypothetical protein